MHARMSAELTLVSLNDTCSMADWMAASTGSRLRLGRSHNSRRIFAVPSLLGLGSFFAGGAAPCGSPLPLDSVQ